MIPEFVSPIANHLWQSTLFAGVAGLLSLALRKNSAAVRYWLWMAASIKFLIPFYLFVAIGGLLGQRSAPATLQPVMTIVVEEITPAFAPVAGSLPSMPIAPASNWTSVLLSTVWALGFLGVSVSWWLQWRRARSAARAGSPMPLDLPVPVISSPVLLEPGVFGIFKPVLLLPRGIMARLTPQQMEAIIAHELCHVRRRDNFLAAVHMLVEAIFWFHPLLWWMRTRLAEEREMACDEEVLRMGNEPRVYARSILQVCKLYLESPLACMSGVSGANLKRRIEGIMSSRISTRLSFPQRTMLAAVAMIAVTSPLVVGMLQAQSSASTRPSFEVASVRVNTTRGPGSQHWGPQEVDLTWAGLLGTIAEAYQIPYTRIVAPQDSKAQDVLRANYDISAKADHAVPKAELLLMLQTLFADRFKLAVHWESKTADVYRLIVAKGGPKLEESTTTGPASGSLIPGGYAVKNSEVWRFCAFLSGRMGLPVVDQTGLAGIYNFTLKLDTLEGLSSSDPEFKTKVSDWSSSSIFSDIQKQLGLQLVSGKAQVGYLVIDHVERPSAN